MKEEKRAMERLVPAVLLVAILVGGLAWAQEKAAQQTVAEDELSVLKQRAAAFWQARISRDFRAQWELLEPRVKGILAPEDYSTGRGALRYLAYQIEDASVNGAFAKVKVRVLAQPAIAALAGRRIVPQAVLLEDPWIRVGGIWYRRLEGEESAPPP